jgi:glycosyltransferase involved in cell wall biosynthesis
MISIVIPTYNDDERLNLVLWGLTQQTNKDFTTVIVNDGGSDDTEELLLSYRYKLKYKYVYLGPPSEEYRPSKARNLGIAACNTDRVIFIDCDVIPLNNLVETHAAFNHNDVIGVGVRSRIKMPRIKVLTTMMKQGILNYEKVIFHSYITDERIREDKYSDTFNALAYPSVLTWDFHCQVEHACLCHSTNISYSLETLIKLDGFSEDYTGILHGEDHDLAIRALKRGCGVVSRPQCVVYHLDHEPRAKHDYPKMLALLERARQSG